MTQLPDDFTILAIETSCDETAAAVVRGGRTVLSNVVASQMTMHQRFGGIVPEVASRQHILSLVPVVEEALRAVPGGWTKIDAVAATYGPGLSGALLTGLNAGKALAWQRGLPFVGVNHLEAHIYASWLEVDDRAVGHGDTGTRGHGDTGTRGHGDTSSRSSHIPMAPPPRVPMAPPPRVPLSPLPLGPAAPPEFPIIALLVSGGHTILALLRGHGEYTLLGQTRDDAVGEAFDKVARILGLGYPGGPAIQQAAQGVMPAGTLPRAWLRETYDFSFSGIKTAVLHKVQERQELAARMPTASAPERKPPRGRAVPATTGVQPPAAPPAPLDPVFVGQIAAAFQESVVDVLTSKAAEAATRYGATAILLAGGVAANLRLREELARRAAVPVRYPPLELCTDNAAMVAAAAYYRFAAGTQSDWALEVVPNLRLGA